MNEWMNKKWEMTGRRELPNEESIRTPGEKRKLQILGNVISEYQQANRDERKC